MKDVIVRWAKTIGCSAVLGILVATGTGCGALGAAANPKVAWAIQDPAPMSVVVRRADVAEKTAQEVDRIMTDTPANDDSPWLQKVAPAKDDATKELAELRSSAIYAQPVRIVPAEVWAKSLAQIERKDAAKKNEPAAPAPAPLPPSSPEATKSEAVAAAPASQPSNPTRDDAPGAPTDEVAKTEEPAEPAAKAATPEVKNGKGGKGRGGKTAKASKPAAPPAKKAAPAKAVVASAKAPKGRSSKGAPPVDKLADKPPPAPPEPQYASAPATPAAAPPTPATATATAPAPAAAAPVAVSTTTTTSAPVPSAMSVPNQPPATAKYPSILAAIDKDLGASYGAIMEKKKSIGELKGRIATEEAALDVKGISDADKKAHKKTIDDCEKQIDVLAKETDKLVDAFIPQAKSAAKKAPADVRDRFGLVLVNLQKAVDDAGIANGAAAVRYPMAATSMPDSAKQMVSVYVADVIEEKTGKRPAPGGFQPNVTLNGTDVQVTINGLSQADMGKLSMSDLTTEVTARTTRWVKRAMGLLGTISSTKEMLSFEDDVLAALLDGFKSSGWSAPAAVVIPDAPAPGAAPATPRS